MRKRYYGWIQRTHIFRRDEFECTDCGYLADAPYAVCPYCGEPKDGTKYDPSWVDELEEIDMILDDD